MEQNTPVEKPLQNTVESSTRKGRGDQYRSIISPYQFYLNFQIIKMTFTHKQDDKLLYEIEITIKAYTKISERDKERINKIALLIDALGFEEERTEKQYRFVKDMDNDKFLLDVEDCTKKQGN